MTRSISKRDSLYMQLIKLLVKALVMATVFFVVLNYIGDYMIESFDYNVSYVEQQNRKHIKALQYYIQKENLSSHDTEQISSWVKQQKMISLRIYKNHKQIFASEDLYDERWDTDIEIDEHSWQKYYSIQFKDGETKVNILGAYIYRIYNYALVAELLVAMGVFLVLVILGIRKKMNYILILSDEIGILEGGSLEYQITIQGKDELAELAQGLDHMRCSFKKLMEEEEKMIRENQNIVTEMSHDLRTPITSIMLYTEILKKGSYENPDKLLEYLEKIDKKARRMKQLTDNLFEYSLVTGENEIQLEDWEGYQSLFYELLSETCSYLQQKGFLVVSHIQWSEQPLQVYSSYLIRIMDNIMSNILKYADAEKKVEINSLYQEKMIGFSFKNAKRQQRSQVESTCVGIQSIKSMMIKMGGNCEVIDKKEYFSISILFPICILNNGNTI